MRSRRSLGAAAVAAAAALTSTAPALAAPDDPPAAAPASAAPDRGAALEGDPAHVVRFPGIRIDPIARTLAVDAWFAVVDGSTRLEYLAVTDKGKVHESLLVLECAPERLQLGLILLGLEPKAEVRYQGEARALTGPRVRVEAEFVRAGERVRVPVEALIYDLYAQAPLAPLGFSFTGSRFLDREGAGPLFAADASGNAIALYHDPDACLDNPRLAGGDLPLLVPSFGMVELVDWLYGDDRLVAHRDRLPDRGTDATLIIEPLGARNSAPAGSAAPPPEAGR
jgi:hypothetical protein